MVRPGLSLAELVVAARVLLDTDIVVARGLLDPLEKTRVVPFGPEAITRQEFESFFQVQLFINDLAWDRTDSPSVVRRAIEGDYRLACPPSCLRNYQLPEDLVP